MLPLLAAIAAVALPGADDAPSPADGVRVAAHLLTGELVVGERYELLVELEHEGVAADAAGFPAPLLQLDVPASVELEGSVLEGQALARNGFVDEPFERLLTELPATVAFTLTAEPAEGATIGMNVVGYVTGADGTQGFLRRRLELPLEAGASALEVEPTTSRWGPAGARLHVGDTLPDFTLPRADGSELSMSQLLGEGPLLIVAYRAHW